MTLINATKIAAILGGLLNLTMMGIEADTLGTFVTLAGFVFAVLAFDILLREVGCGRVPR